MRDNNETTGLPLWLAGVMIAIKRIIRRATLYVALDCLVIVLSRAVSRLHLVCYVMDRLAVGFNLIAIHQTRGRQVFIHNRRWHKVSVI